MAEQEDALVVDQVNVEASPLDTVEGCAPSLIVGTAACATAGRGMATLTSATNAPRIIAVNLGVSLVPAALFTEGEVKGRQLANEFIKAASSCERLGTRFLPGMFESMRVRLFSSVAT
jgi:hypothetical protein